MRKYVLSFTRQAYDEHKIDWNTYITKVSCYGLKELKETIKYYTETIGKQYLEPTAEILSGDGENAQYIGEKKI